MTLKWQYPTNIFWWSLAFAQICGLIRGNAGKTRSSGRCCTMHLDKRWVNISTSNILESGKSSRHECLIMIIADNYIYTGAWYRLARFWNLIVIEIPQYFCSAPKNDEINLNCGCSRWVFSGRSSIWMFDSKYSAPRPARPARCHPFSTCSSDCWRKQFQCEHDHRRC